MSSDGAEIEEVEVEVEDLTPDADPIEAKEPEAEIDVEAQDEAKKYGWRDKGDFDLAPDGWVDANKFLGLPSTQMKKMRDESKARDADYDTRIQNIEKANRIAIEKAVSAERALHDQQLSGIDTQQRDAAENGDLEAYDRLAVERSKLKEPEPVSMPIAEADDRAAQLEAFKASNEWTNDPVMFNAARTAIDQNPAILQRPVSEQLAYATSKVREYFPQKFEQPKRKRQMVDPGGLAGSKQSLSLPPEAEKIGREFVADGIFKNITEYAKAYHSEDN